MNYKRSKIRRLSWDAGFCTYEIEYTIPIEGETIQGEDSESEYIEDLDLTVHRRAPHNTKVESYEWLLIKRMITQGELYGMYDDQIITDKQYEDGRSPLG